MDAEQERARRNALKVIDERLRALHNHLVELPIDRFVQLLDQSAVRSKSGSSVANTGGKQNRDEDINCRALSGDIFRPICNLPSRHGQCRGFHDDTDSIQTTGQSGPSPSRLDATWGISSMAWQKRPVISAAMMVVPDPQNGCVDGALKPSSRRNGGRSGNDSCRDETVAEYRAGFGPVRSCVGSKPLTPPTAQA
jgi:hypothetical protein